MSAHTRTEGRGRRNERIGVVVSDSANKTIKVEISRLVKHSRYGKYMRSKNKFTAHDEKNEAKVGDKVLIVETRPLSKTKRWKLVSVIEKAVQEGV